MIDDVISDIRYFLLSYYRLSQAPYSFTVNDGRHFHSSMRAIAHLQEKFQKGRGQSVSICVPAQHVAGTANPHLLQTRLIPSGISNNRLDKMAER